MDNASSLALLVAALVGAVAYAAVSKTPPSSPSQQVIEVASNTAPTESKRLPEPEAPPEPAIVIVHSRTPPAEKTVRPQPSLTGDPVHFVREVQRELRRVGCYHQAIDGEWGPATRRAMKDFTDRANAVLPLDRPDPVLLALLQSQSKVVCGDTCPAGQDHTKDNRCHPSALPRDASTSPVATTASVAPARRVPRRSSNFGFGFLGLFGW